MITVGKLQRLAWCRFSVLCLIPILGAAVLSASAQDLPPDVLADMHLLRATKALEAGDTQTALKAFEQIEALDAARPPQFAFFYGKLLVESATALEDLLKGESLLKQYVMAVDKSSGNYVAALELLNAAAVKLEELDARRQERRQKERMVRLNPLRPTGDAFADALASGGKGPEMVVIPAGGFRMGSASGLNWGWEEPVHAVRIGKPFALGRREVTFAEWDACAAAGGCGGYLPADQGWGRGNRPVIRVTWTRARAYASWLSRETGRSYRLPSESEWEYAARAGTVAKYSWGNGIGRARANCDGCGSRWDGDRTAPVGSFAANAFGLHDMHGNVREWVEDCWNESYAGAPTDGSAWLRGDCTQRVLRGGSWYSSSRTLRAAYRYGSSTDYFFNTTGFRVARTLTP